MCTQRLTPLLTRLLEAGVCASGRKGSDELPSETPARYDVTLQHSIMVCMHVL